jgi:hypothetical protein
VKWVRREFPGATSSQETTALELIGRSGPRSSSYARTRPDGLAELRTVLGGEYRLYIIEEEGTATLVEVGDAGSAGSVKRAADAVSTCAVILAFAMVPTWPVTSVEWRFEIFSAACALTFCAQMIAHRLLTPGAGWTYITLAERRRLENCAAADVP